VTVSGLAERARVSRKTFYDYFGNRDQCVDYAAEAACAHLFEPIGRMTAQAADERVAAGVRALLDAVKAEPNQAELALIHAPALGGERGRRFQEIAVEAIAILPAAAGAATEKGVRGTETIAGAMIGVIACKLRHGEADRVGEPAGELMRLAMLPAIGA
jgi:AcrR family transcriptional regulator